MVIFGLFGVWLFTHILRMPRSILNWIIFLLCVIGSFGINNNLLDVWMMFIFGLLGYVMEKNEFPLTPLVLGIILGPIAENALLRGMIIYDSFWSFFTRPIAGTLLIIAILSALSPMIRNIIKRTKTSA